MQLSRQHAVATRRAVSAASSRPITMRARGISSPMPSPQARSSGMVTMAAAVAEAGVKKAGPPPAVLEGTPKAGEFPIPPERLIEIAKTLFDAQSGVLDPSLLSDDFRFEFPVVSLSKEEFIKAVSSFKIYDAFPDMSPNPYHWRVDPYEPNRVWFTVRYAGTHTGDLKFFNTQLNATNKVVYGAPECMSYTFNAEGKCTSHTGGYILDRRVGNTQGLGAMFGIVAAVGGPVLKPGSFAYTMLMLQTRLANLFKGK